jgi:hypothetical protein
MSHTSPHSIFQFQLPLCSLRRPTRACSIHGVTPHRHAGAARAQADGRHIRCHREQPTCSMGLPCYAHSTAARRPPLWAPHVRPGCPRRLTRAPLLVRWGHLEAAQQVRKKRPPPRAPPHRRHSQARPRGCPWAPSLSGDRESTPKHLPAGMALEATPFSPPRQDNASRHSCAALVGEPSFASPLSSLPKNALGYRLPVGGFCIAVQCVPATKNGFRCHCWR